MPIIAFDIGGANLKASDGRSRSVSRPFAIWKEPERLAVELRELLQEFGGAAKSQESGVRDQGQQSDFSPSPPLGTGELEEQLQRGGEGRGEGFKLRPSPQPSPPHPMQHSEESRLRGRGSEEESGVRSDVAETTSSVKPQASSHTSIAVTMTAELADCFSTKAEGVHFILDAVAEVAGGCVVLVWQTGGEFVSIDEARELVPLVAAANWHALATWAARLTLGADASAALLIDLGSTTCDIIPLVGGLPMPTGRTDVERLMSSELVYTGVRRTPLMAVSPIVPFRRASVPLAAELFATMLDVYLLTGEIAEDPQDTNTANGQSATVDAAWDRIARSLCCDRSECTLEEAREIAHHLRSAQHLQITSAIEHVASPLPSPFQLVLSGEGEPMLRRIIESPDISPFTSQPTVLSLNDLLGPTHSSCACAYALARLAEERG